MDSGWLKVLDIGGPKSIALALASGGVHFAMIHKLFGLDKLPAIAEPISGLAMVVFGAFGVVWIIGQVFAVPKLWFRGRSRAVYLREALSSLSLEEASVLARMATGNARSTRGSIWDPVMMALCQKGLLAQAGGTGLPENWAFTIPANVWPEVRKWGTARQLAK